MSPGTSRSSAAAAVAPVSIAWPMCETSNSAGLRPAVQMLGHHAAAAARGQVAGEVVLHRHGIAGERHHAGAVAAVPGVERRGQQRRGRGVVWQGVLDHRSISANRVIRRRDAGSS